jgi:hypothetical protein
MTPYITHDSTAIPPISNPPSPTSTPPSTRSFVGDCIPFFDGFILDEIMDELGGLFNEIDMIRQRTSNRFEPSHFAGAFLNQLTQDLRFTRTFNNLRVRPSVPLHSACEMNHQMTRQMKHPVENR